MPELTRTYIDTEELAVRIAEAVMGMKRHPMATAKSAMEDCRRGAPDAAAGFQRAALAAAEYIAECCNAVNPGQVGDPPTPCRVCNPKGEKEDGYL